MNDDISEITLDELEDQASAGSASLAQLSMDLVGHLSVGVTVSVGTTDISLERLFSLKAGEVLQLQEDLNAPVTVMVDGKPVAYGNLVAVNDCFGVQITQVAE